MHPAQNRSLRELLLDVETTGLNRNSEAGDLDRIVEVGIVEHINGQPTGRTFQVYINPEREVPEDAQKVHGLSTEFLMNKPRFAEIAGALLEFVGPNPTFVAHFKEFDVGFLNLELELAGLPAYDVADHICTAVLWKELEPNKSRRLDIVCAELGIDNSHRNKHGALVDAELLSQVYRIITERRQTVQSEEDFSIDPF